MRALCIVTAFTVTAAAFAQNVPPPSPLPSEELRGGVTTASDGFFVRVDAHMDKDTAGDFVSLLLTVPQKVGGTELYICRLQMLDFRGREVLSVPVEPRGDSGSKERPIDFWGERRVAKRCRLLLIYGQPPLGYLVKKYVFPLEPHLPRRK